MGGQAPAQPAAAPTGNGGKRVYPYQGSFVMLPNHRLFESMFARDAVVG